jgi:hypothetical protein
MSAQFAVGSRQEAPIHEFNVEWAAAPCLRPTAICLPECER